MRSVTVTIVIILLIATVLIIFQPLKFFDGDEWTLYFVTRHFSQWVFSIDQTQLNKQRSEARKLSSRLGSDIGGLGLGSYRPRSDGRYVVEKSPGYFILLGLSSRFSLERVLNLFFCMSLLFILAYYGKLTLSQSHTRAILWMVVFTPAALIMLYRPYMESFASMSLVGMGGISYLIADALETSKQKYQRKALLWWALSGLFLGYAFFVRTALLPTIIIFVIHFFYRYWGLRQEGKYEGKELALIVFGSGLLIFLFFVLIYNNYVNGSALTFGYNLGKPKQSVYCFSFQSLFHDEPERPYAIIIRNLIGMPEQLINAYPLLLLAIAGVPLAFRHLRKDIFILILCWIMSIYFLYLQFLVFNTRHFMVIGRLYLPALIPLAILAGYTVEKLGETPRKIVLIGLISLGIISYFYFLCQISIDPFGLGILDTFQLKNWISYK